MACDGTRVQLVTIDVVSVMIGDMEDNDCDSKLDEEICDDDIGKSKAVTSVPDDYCRNRENSDKFSLGVVTS